MRACVWTRLAKATATAVLIEAITLKRASCALRKYFSDNRIWHSVWLSERVSNSECQRCKTKKKETSGYRAVFVSGSPSRRQTTAVSSKCRRTIGILVNQSGDYKLKHCIFLRCAVVPKMATYEPAACSFQIALFFLTFKVLLDFCFDFCLRVWRAAKASQPHNSMFSNGLQKHDYLRLKRKKTEWILCYSGAKKKKRFPHSLPPPNICPSVTSSLQTAQRNLPHLNTHIWRAKSLGMPGFHFENNSNFTTTPPLLHICQEGNTEKAEGTQERKCTSGEIPSQAENETWIWNTFHYSHNLQLEENASSRALYFKERAARTWQKKSLRAQT